MLQDASRCFKMLQDASSRACYYSCDELNGLSIDTMITMASQQELCGPIAQHRCLVVLLYLLREMILTSHCQKVLGSFSCRLCFLIDYRIIHKHTLTCSICFNTCVNHFRSVQTFSVSCESPFRFPRQGDGTGIPTFSRLVTKMCEDVVFR